jgi:hypothetical protein
MSTYILSEKAYDIERTHSISYKTQENTGFELPYALSEETKWIRNHLSDINALGLLTTSSQPATFRCDISEFFKCNHYTFHGRTHHYQRAYVAGLMSVEGYERLMCVTDRCKDMINVIQRTDRIAQLSSDDVERVSPFDGGLYNAMILYSDKPSSEVEYKWYGHMYEDYYEQTFGLDRKDMESFKVVMLVDKNALTKEHTKGRESFWENAKMLLKLSKQ